MDLPGIYSLSPYSNEEIISRYYILDEKPDVIVNIVDASNLERNLYLTTQLIELGVPVVVALNMMDIVKSKGEELSASALAKELDCPVCEISAIKKTGIDGLKKEIGKVLKGDGKVPEHNFQYDDDVHNAIEELKKFYEVEGESDFYSLKVLSNDEEFIKKHNIQAEAVAKGAELRSQIEASYDDDINSIITEQRYNWIKKIIDSIILKRRKETLTLSDKIDKVLTNKWLGLPIFLLIIYVIYFIFLKKTMLKGEAAPFVMELPEYKMPRLKNVVHFVIEKTISFFKKAATIIFISTVVIWALKYFAISFDPTFKIISNTPIDQSILANIGRLLTPIFMPIGIDSWQLVSSLITGYVAKENVITTMGIIYGEDVFGAMKTLLPTTASALSFLFFFIISSPCFASMGAMRKELGSAKETWKAIGFQMATAYIISFVIYWVGTGITMLIK